MTYLLCKKTPAGETSYLAGWVQDWHSKPIGCASFDAGRARIFESREDAQSVRKAIYMGNRWTVVQQ